MPRRWFFDINYYRHAKAKRRSRRLFKLFIVLLIAGGIYIAIDALYLNRGSGPSDPTTAVESVYEVPSKTFKTDYFELETPESWQFEEKASKPGLYVYHNVRHKLVRGFITVYVNREPVPHHKQATRLLPVEVNVNNFLVPDSNVTPHCNKTAPSKDKAGEELVKLKGITFMCDNDATWFSVFVALKGGTPQMTLEGADGKPATYVIYYQDSSADPTANDFIEVIRKFKIL